MEATTISGESSIAEFGDIRTGDKGAALADDNHGFDDVIGLGLRHTGHQTFTNSMGQRIDRGVLDPQYGHVAFAGISNLVSHLAYSLV